MDSAVDEAASRLYAHIADVKSAHSEIRPLAISASFAFALVFYGGISEAKTAVRSTDSGPSMRARWFGPNGELPRNEDASFTPDPARTRDLAQTIISSAGRSDVQVPGTAFRLLWVETGPTAAVASFRGADEQFLAMAIYLTRDGQAEDARAIEQARTVSGREIPFAVSRAIHEQPRPLGIMLLSSMDLFRDAALTSAIFDLGAAVRMAKLTDAGRMLKRIVRGTADTAVGMQQSIGLSQEEQRFSAEAGLAICQKLSHEVACEAIPAQAVPHVLAKALEIAERLGNR